MSWKQKSHNDVAMLACVVICGLHAISCHPAIAQEVADSIVSNGGSSVIEQEDGWTTRQDDMGTTITRHLTLHPKLEPVPALKYRFIPDEFERTDGNAAVFYLKALGFLEETRARELLSKFHRESQKKAEESGEDDYPPYTWMKMNPKDLPVEEVKQYLRLVDFQPPLLREASYRNNFSMDRNIRQVENPIMYLLPEINTMRETARYQSLRFRLALAEDRIDDAIEVLGQNFALAAHLGQDDFFVSTLVGIAIAAIAWNDTMYLLERPDVPNLYWAFASLPKPLVGIRRALAYERNLLFEQVKLLREVDMHPRDAGYWRDFVDRLIDQSDSFEPVLNVDWKLKDMDPNAARSIVASMIAAAYPGAKRYLAKDAQLDLEMLDSYPKAQTVFLAMKIYSERARDEQLKWQHIPYPLVEASPLYAESLEKMRLDEREIGWITKPAQALLPAVHAVATANERNQQRIALAQTVEAIRFYAAKNDNRLPRNLNSLALPSVPDPITGRPFEYRVKGNRAFIGMAEAAGIRTQFVLEIAE